MVDIVAYHADCPDGFCAAYVAQRKYPQARLLPATHGQAPPPILQNKHVLVVDFSWKRDICLELARSTKSFRILDHHATAEKELEGLDFAVFDMHRSGATITWDYCFPTVERPWYVAYVEDRDLWRWKLADSVAINAYIMALPQTVDAWRTLDSMPIDQARLYGAAIRLHIDHYIEKVIAQRFIGHFWAHSVAVVNAPYLNISEVGHALLEFAAIGIGWFERADGMIQFSLRSQGDIDVSEYARMYGGGGHKHAAGFQVARGIGRGLIENMRGSVLKGSV